MARQTLWHRLIGPRSLSERRESERLRQRGVKCNLGAVLDISPTGMRMLSTSALEGQVSITLDGGDAQVTLHAAVVWSRRLGFRRHMAGLRFADVDAAEAELLMRIAAAHQTTTAI